MQDVSLCEAALFFSRHALPLNKLRDLAGQGSARKWTNFRHASANVWPHIELRRTTRRRRMTPIPASDAPGREASKSRFMLPKP